MSESFSYYSTKRGHQVLLGRELVRDLRNYLVSRGFNRQWTTEQLMECLLAYRDPTGKRLLINHLNPVYCYLAEFGELWPT